jgi:hypothetical protein
MAVHRQAILLLAPDLPLARHPLAVLSHGQAGPRFGVGREYRLEFTQAEPLERTQPLSGAAGGVGLDQPLGKLAAISDGRVRCRVGAGGDSGLDLAGRDPIISAACRLVPQACCRVIPGVNGDSEVDSSASRARLKSFEWEVTAPAMTSSSCAPSRPKRSVSPCKAADSMSRLVFSA